VIPPNALLIFDVELLAIAPQQPHAMGMPSGMEGMPGGAEAMPGAPEGAPAQ
jgi:hypothetical protein